MRAAVVDLGTNTFNLIIAEKNNGKLYTVCRERKFVKIGKGGLAENIITEDAYQRAINAVKYYAELIKKYNVDKIKAIATSAFRSTKNGENLAKELESILNSPVEIIDGDKEAEYIYYGVRLAVPLSNENVLIVDIGGGSNELIIANNEKIIWKKSYQLGVARLMEIFRPKDPFTPEDIKNIREHIIKNIDDFIKEVQFYNPVTLIGSSGSFDLIANVLSYKLNDKPINPDISYNKLNYLHFYKLIETFIISSYEQRLLMKGMDLARIEMMPIASLFIRTILEFFKPKNIIHSNYAIKEGVWAKTFMNN
jgi:exopolyphosphatase/guanosine-5'-triphosphate,3'-diphosphate pyrophosphatase